MKMVPPDSLEHRQLVVAVRAELTRMSGRFPVVRLDVLDVESLRDLQRFLRDIDDAHRQELRRASAFPQRPQ